jgi:hypothetical protein
VERLIVAIERRAVPLVAAAALLTIAAAFVADLVILPALLVLVGRERTAESVNRPVSGPGARR